MRRALAEQRGHRAERIAAWHLRMKGWRIVDTRVRTPVGEIDIVARRFRTTAFAEVKTREKSANLDYAVDKHRLRRVTAAASALTARLAGRRRTHRRHPGRAGAATQTPLQRMGRLE
jgi:putative endonuclease